MKIKGLLILALSAILVASCKNVQTEISYENPDMKVIFLHHSTGNNVWYGDVDQYARLRFKNETAMVPRLLDEYNQTAENVIQIEERAFPSGDPYPWRNYPYDYYNIWVKNAGQEAFMSEPTLEMLTPEYDLIIFKFCFPYSKVLADDGEPDINSEKKTIANYKLQYNALKEKMHEFPDTKFLVWTGAALLENHTTEEEAIRAKEINDWVINHWDTKGDNIFLFDFREIETRGDLYLLPEYAVGNNDSHPNIKVSTIAAKQLVERIIDVVQK